MTVVDALCAELQARGLPEDDVTAQLLFAVAARVDEAEDAGTVISGCRLLLAQLSRLAPADDGPEWLTSLGH
jgi:hypothetical protein